jgi:serine/threonine-protein kinase
MPESKRRDEDGELIGATINGRYRIIELLARGGMGKVYKAEQSALGRVCALKVLSPNYEGDKDPEFHRRFSLEAETAAKLTHPNTVTIFDYGKCEKHHVYYIAMEYLDGRTLHRAIHDEKTLSEERACHIATQICRSVGEAHRHGIVHRDLKPSNVMLCDRGDEPDFVKVLDFGLVKDVSANAEELTQTGLFMGSPKYMAPEQVMGTGVSARTDVYAVGIVLYEMMTGKVPFDRKAGMSTLIAHVNEKVPPMRERYPDISLSPEMEAVILRCLEKDPEKRFASMRDLLLALKRAGGDLTETQESLPRVRLDQGPTSVPPASFSGAGEASTTGSRSKVSLPPPSGTLASQLASPLASTLAPAPVPADSLAPPAQPSRTFTGVLPAAPVPAWRPYALALVASILGGGTAALVLSRRAEPAVRPGADPAATASAAVAIAVSPSAEPPRGPGIRILRIESEPAGATVADQGVQVCMATPCEVYWRGDSARLEHRLVLSKKGFKTATVTVGPDDEKVRGVLDVWSMSDIAAAGVQPAPAAPDPYAAVTAPAASTAPGTAPTAPVAPAAISAPSTGGASPPTTTAAPAPASATPAAAPVPSAAAAGGVAHMEEGMTRPTRLSGGNPAYSREAIEAKAAGTVVAKCVISEVGTLSGCRIVKGVPFMDGPVLAALASWRYNPATREGKPVAVDYAITLKLVPP